MIRNLFCYECRDKMNLYPEDIATGWKMRRVIVEKAKVPNHHQIEIHAGAEPVQVIPVPMLVCDSCGQDIPEGAPATAVTMWRYPDGEPGNWELAFSQPENHGQPGHDTA